MEQACADNVIVMPKRRKTGRSWYASCAGSASKKKRVGFRSRCVVCRPNKEAPYQPSRPAPT